MSQYPQIGQPLRNRYKIVQLLGSGGFGDTYLAVDLDLPGQPQCVVKHLKPKDPNPAVLLIAKSLFEREAQILYRLGNDSDQIPRLFAHFEENGEFYLVQEFVDGHDLSKEITPGKPLSENVVFKLLKDILEVLAVVHQHNVIHRDIKPQNLMRRRKDGKIVLIDFGAVKEIGAMVINAQGQTSVTVAIGSPGYMPSEQANGKPKLSSDVYAVGMLTIQALTGLMPHQLQEDPSTGEVIWRNNAQVSDRLADVLDRMVRDHFSQRYQSAALALQGLISTVALPPPPPSPVPSIPKQPATKPVVAAMQQPTSAQPTLFPRRSFVPVLLGIFLLLSLAGGLVAVYFKIPQFYTWVNDRFGPIFSRSGTPESPTSPSPAPVPPETSAVSLEKGSLIQIQKPIDLYETEESLKPPAIASNKQPPQKQPPPVSLKGSVSAGSVLEIVDRSVQGDFLKLRICSIPPGKTPALKQTPPSGNNAEPSPTPSEPNRVGNDSAQLKPGDEGWIQEKTLILAVGKNVDKSEVVECRPASNPQINQ